jgi:hypothetical protein
LLMLEAQDWRDCFGRCKMLAWLPIPGWRLLSLLDQRNLVRCCEDLDGIIIKFDCKNSVRNDLENLTFQKVKMEPNCQEQFEKWNTQKFTQI